MGKKVRNYKFFDNYSWFVPGVKEMLILLLMLLLGGVLGNVITLLFTAVLGTAKGTEYAMVVSYPVMFIPAMMYAGAKSRARSFTGSGLKLDSDNFSPVGGALCALLAAVGTMTLAFCTDALNQLMPPAPEWLEQTLKSMTQGNFFLNFLCVSIFAPFFEEWLCRGMVLRGLLGNKVKPSWAIVISALFFAMIHLNPWQALPAFLLGCLFGYVYYKTGSLKLTMLMHFTNNTLALVMSNIDSLKDADNWAELLPGVQYWILFTVCLMATYLVVMKFKRVESTPEGNCDSVPSLFAE